MPSDPAHVQHPDDPDGPEPGGSTIDPISGAPQDHPVREAADDGS